MSKKVLDVGNCSLDRRSIRQLLKDDFDAQVLAVPGSEEALEALRRDRFDLVLVNREFARSKALGVELIRQIKVDPRLADVPVMLLSDYAEAQQEAVAAGADPGFGKAELDCDETRAKLAAFLD